MRYVLGIDQGGSKTYAIVADERGSILGFGAGPGACHSVNGLQRALDAIEAAVAQACGEAGIAARQIERVCAGLTGVDWPHEGPMLRGAVAGLLQLEPERVSIVNDCIIALRAGTAKDKSCILCAGSGLNCAVRSGERLYTFGFYIEDRCQGGQALGLRTVQAVFDAESGLLPPTELTRPVLAHMGCDSVDELLERQVTAGLDSSAVLQLPRVLEKIALEGDGVALEVLRVFGRDIARYAVAGLARFDMLKSEVDVVLSGSVFKCRARVLQDTVTQEIRKRAPRINVIQSEYEPIVGAALMALDDLGGCGGAPAGERLARGAKRLGLIRNAPAQFED